MLEYGVSDTLSDSVSRTQSTYVQSHVVILFLLSLKCTYVRSRSLQCFLCSCHFNQSAVG